MAQPGPNDALGLLTAALNASSPQVEATSLRQLYDLLQTQAGNLPILLPHLVTLASKRPTLSDWFASVLDLAFCRSTLSIEGRAGLSIHTPEALLAYLNNPNVQAPSIKTAIQVFASVYQHLFKHCCTDTSENSRRTWQNVEQIKHLILQLFNSGHTGVKIAAIKAFQRIIQVQTRVVIDPRNRGGPSKINNVHDSSISSIPMGHPFLNTAQLEAEANQLLKQVVTLVFTYSNVDLVMASMNVLSLLAKARPALIKIVIEALVSWTPAALVGQSHTSIRNVEKTLRLIFIHFHRNGLAAEHASQIQTALAQQQQRMEAAARADWERKEAEAKRKREYIDDEITQAGKRQRKEEEPIDIYSTQSSVAGPSSAPAQPDQLSGMEGARAFCLAAQDDNRPNPLAAFDVTTLPIGLVIELILANLQAIPDQDLHGAINRTRQRLNASTSGAAPPGPPPLRQGPGLKQEDGEDGMNTPPPPENPLKRDLEEDDLRMLDERGARGGEVEEDPEDEDNALAGLEDFELAPPEPFSQTEAKALIKESILRMCEMGGQAAALSAELGDDVPPQTLWATLVIRLASRGFDGPGEEADGAEEQEGESTEVAKPAAGSLKSQADAIRQLMLDFLRADFPSRVSFAIQWLSEEWYCDLDRRKRGQPLKYATWLLKVVQAALPSVDPEGKSLSSFLAELPDLPEDVVDLIAELCHDKAKIAVGFTVMRELAVSRPPSRAKAVRVLLDLSRNSDKSLRARAIITIRAWVGAAGPLQELVLKSARDSLERLKVQDPPKTEAEQAAAKPAGDEEGAVEEESRDPVTDPTFQLKDEMHVLQFVELPFALSIKMPSVLDDVFEAYPAMPLEVQKAVQKHIAALIRSLGPNNPKLLQILKTFPAGSDTLALSVFNIMAEKGRTQALLSAVKAMVSEREVDPHFLIPIMPLLTKPEIKKHLPHAVTILNSKSVEDRNTLKALFVSIVTKPAQGFGSVSTNLPRVRDSDLLTPVELLCLLHSAEKEIGLKTTVDAIGICFSMTDVFRSEVLAAAMNQIAEEPELPVVFMRTAIRAVSTYKSLAGYVSSNLLSRLIVKKVWQKKLLWDGFVICAEQTAPGSFPALLQLPQEQLLDVVQRKPALKQGLKDHLEKKVGNKARLNAYLELLDGGAAGPGAGGETNGSGSAASTPQHA